MADNRDLHARANDTFQKLVGGLSEAQWDAQTPCTEWKVKDLVDHVVGGNKMFAAVARGEEPSGEKTEGDLEAAHAESAKLAAEAFAPDEVNEKMFALPF